MSTTVPTEAPQQVKAPVKLGVGIGVPIGVAALVAIGVLLWRRRRRYYSEFVDRYQLSEMHQEEREVPQVGETQGYGSLHDLPHDDRKAHEFGSPRGHKGLHQLLVDHRFDSRAELDGHRNCESGDLSLAVARRIVVSWRMFKAIVVNSTALIP